MTNLQYNKIKVILMIMCILLVGSGCGVNKPAESLSSRTFQDDVGRSVQIEKTDKKIVALSNSFLDILHGLDAKVIGIPNTKETDLNPVFFNS